MANRKRSLVWAMDPFSDDESGHRVAADYARDWQKRTGGLVIPTYVLSMRQTGEQLEFEYDPLQFLENEAKKRMSQWLWKLRVPSFEEPQIFVADAMTRSQEADALSRFAIDHGAEMILMNTHALRGIKRALMGSFTEAALLRSKVPVLTINPNIQQSRPIQRILFPTEFGRYAHRVFRRVLSLAEELGASITMLHVTQSIIGREMMTGIAGYPIPQEVLTDELNYLQHSTERRFKRWARVAEDRGIHADFVILPPGTAIARGIVSTARRQSIDLITLEAESGWISSALLGSVSRQVVRNSVSPVWVIRPRMAFAARARATRRPIVKPRRVA